ncbi:hypothetical protein J4G48_0040445 [Bradyrhizobium barranii subsp. apii]|uniref:hypothetical protein n=1 Tax=Bradyrhizobium barranii TaxID=2992140 RepID=UPI001AA16FCA|nr:hypothetical protein [Bradyrhizobium barranii]UPT95427.1 hypothetical protein J4G48_0040445 [Bradyrhizobium barranii subsp. apii]
MFIPNIVDPAVVESQVRALKLADYYLRQGEDAFTFENEQGRAYVITRKMGVEQYLTAGDKLVGFTSSRIFEVVGGHWAEPGRA